MSSTIGWNREGDYVMCPLFRAYTNNSIRCEPHVPEADAMDLRYWDPKKCEQQRKLYCEGNWKRCEHYLSWRHMVWQDEEDK